MSLKYGLLGLLNYGNMTGYDLDKAFKDSLSFIWTGDTSQIYRELNAMEKSGWLTSEIVIQTDKPNKKVYHITETGKQALLQWLAGNNNGVDEMFQIRSAFLMRLFFAGDAPIEQTVKMVRSYRDKCREVLQEMAATPESIKKYQVLIEHPERADYWRLAAMFGRTYYEASIQWAETALSILEKRK